MLSIYARVITGKLNRKYTLGYIIAETEWKNYLQHNYTSTTVINTLDIKYVRFAEVLDRLKHYFTNEYNPHNATDMIQRIKREVLYSSIESDGVGKTSKYYLDEYILKYHKELLTGSRLKSGCTVKVCKQHADCYYGLYKKIMNLQFSKLKRYKFEDVDMTFRNDFLSWLRNKQYSHNTICRTLQLIYCVMMAAFTEDLTDNDIRKYKSFLLRKTDVENVYLTREQINILYELDLSSRETIKGIIDDNIDDEQRKHEYYKEIRSNTISTLRNCRDIFVVGCLTGQRESDYSRINKNMFTKIKNDWYICLVQKKTAKKLYVPLDAKVKNILDRHNGILPRYHLNTINYSIARLCKFLGWEHDTEIPRKRMGHTLSSRFCDMVASHTARRSFATNAYAARIPVQSIMAITGHAHEESFRKYIHLEAEENSLQAAEDLNDFMDL